MYESLDFSVDIVKWHVGHRHEAIRSDLECQRKGIQQNTAGIARM